MLLLARRTVEILGGLVHELVGWGSAHGQVDMLGRAAPGRPGPTLGSIVTVPLHAFDQFSSFWIHFSEWIN